MSHQDKFWNKFGDKVRQHEPGLYAPADWQQMERLLDNKPARRFLPIFLWSGGAIASLLAMAVLLWLSAPDIPAISAFPIPLAKGEEPLPIAAISQAKKDVADAVAFLPVEKASTALGQQKAKTGGSSKAKAGTSKTSTGKESQMQQIPVLSGAGAVSAVEKERENTYLLEQQVDTAVDTREWPRVKQAEKLATLLGPAAYEKAENTISAREIREKAWTFGAGAILGAQLPITRYSNIEGGVSPFIGLFAKASPHPKWAIQLEVQARYVPEMKVQFEFPVAPGTSSNFSDTVMVSGRQQVDFLSIQAPLLLKYRIHPRLYIHAGVEAGFIFENPGFASASEDFVATPVSSDTPEGEEGFDMSRSAKMAILNLRKHSWGAFAGLEWAFARKWSAVLRTTHGFTDLSPNSLYIDEGHHRNSGVQLSLYKSF